MDAYSWDNNSEVSYSHFQATSHYHSNRFSQAADSFQNTLNVLATNNQDHDSSSSHHQIPTTSQSRNVVVNHHQTKIIRNDIFSVLNRTALEADRTLCLFRSSLQQSQPNESSNEEGTDVSLLLQARKANEEHANVLEGIVSSMDEYDERNDNENDKDQLYIISKLRIDVALALLMTGVSSLWLHLHDVRDVSVGTSTITVRCEEENDKEYLKYIICRAIRLAGCCFLNRKGGVGVGTYCTPTWTESLSIMNWLLLGNGSTKSNMDNEENFILFKERDRIKEALSSVRHALLIVDLSLSTSTSANTISRNRSFIQEIPSNCGMNTKDVHNFSKKRKRANSTSSDNTLDVENGNSPSQKAKLEKNPSNVPHGYNEDSSDDKDIRIANEDEDEDELSTNKIQQLLTKALWHHLQLQHHLPKTTNTIQTHFDFHRQSRDTLMKKVLKFDRSIVSKSVSIFTLVSDMLMNESQSSIKKWKNIASKAETTMPQSSHMISLLGCIHASKFGDAARGLALFQKALIIQKNDNVNDQVESILSNMSSCYAMLGHPKPVVELLIHKTTLTKPTKTTITSSNADIIDTTKITLHESMQTLKNQIFDSSTLWRLYYSSSLMQDWDTCSQSIEHLHRMNPSYCTVICLMFAKLEMDRPIDASKIYTEVENFNKLPPNHQCCVCGDILSILLNIFYADAMIHSQISHTKKKECTRDDMDTSHIIELTSTAMSLINKARSKQKPVHSNRLLSYLEACILNNHAFGLVMNGNNFEALSFFSKAVHLMKNASGLMAVDECNFLYPLYNMVILLLKEGYHKEASSVWKNVTELSKETKYIGTRNVCNNDLKIQFALLDKIVHSTEDM